MRRFLGQGVTALVGVVGLLVMSGCGPAPGYEPPPQVPPPYAEPVPPGYSPSSSGGGMAGEATGAPSGPSNAGYASDEIAIGADTDEYSDTDPSALTDFRPALDGHGEWVDDSAYGTVWVPAENEVGSDFVPYVSAGHWTYDDTTSWVWVSDYSWGWAPFHYGRWVHVGRRGWAWIPGRVYSGAWVVWRTGAPGYDYVGWAPAAPDWYWYGGTAVAWSFGWSPYYYYCNHHYLYGPGLYGHVYHGHGARDYEAHTRPYVPASPSTNAPGRVAANPTVGNGSGTGGRVAASPRVGAGLAARGPSPDEIGIKRDQVVAPPRGNRELDRAQAFASPRTAAPLGGSTPSAMRPNAMTASRAPDGSRYGFGPGKPVDRDMVVTPNQFDLRGGGPHNPVVSSRIDPVARAPQYQQPQYQPGAGPPVASGPRPSSSTVLPEYRSNANARMATPGLSDANHENFPSGAQRPNVPAPSAIRQAPSMTTPPTMRSAPSMTAPPTVRSSPPVASPSQPTFRSAPTVSAPTFRSTPSVSAPAIRSTPSTPTFRSTPTVSAPRPSTPTVSAPRPSTPSRPSAPSAPVRSGGGVRRR
ncbi:DUF6600 domain-containing protein [Labilithrix luteola]|nr:DUF6600 domain-containing protein [Labilithrix luteola]